ncbi:Acetylglucosaminyltransferase EXT1/exostosin 1 [Handroanthus impetiginosus]|uniref:Acetylglucosaminyltransferase EXT1/exostosin 1 n=1 Tax=Handroanthus impetiginosus TaxID=429701 RepID=A0A2G9HNW9_9LAMI|nr:Acetylglucosaminyltransferase EXT1/exostosin 1 [Handroanthus impetiginosus]
MVGSSSGRYVNDKELIHDKDMFIENYKQMNGSLMIYACPHRQDEPYANVLLPVDFELGGNYASESNFKKVFLSCHFITKDTSSADLFFLPFSIARLHYDPQVGIDGIQDFIRDYIFNISHEYPYGNCSGGADHFYVACHSIGRSTMEKAFEVELNAIQIVCSSSYYIASYVAHKDASSKLVFFAGSITLSVREKLLQVWENDSKISVNSGHLLTSSSDELLRSKFCLHVKGFKVNTARIGNALYYGCFFSYCRHIRYPSSEENPPRISHKEYLILQSNVLKVREHFQWHLSLVDYDAFYMVMYELWL